MTLLLTSLIIIASVLLVVIIMVQNPKGGGLSSSFGGGGTQLFGGVKKTTDFLDRGTWSLAIVLVVLVLAMNVVLTPPQGGSALPQQGESEVGRELNERAPIPQQQQQRGQQQQQPGQQVPDMEQNLPQPVDED